MVIMTIGGLMNKKGFTLIELLAVIVILAIIAIITSPLVLDSIALARDSSYRTSVINIAKIGEDYYAQKYLNQEAFSYDQNIYDDISFKGYKAEDGQLVINNNGQVGSCYCIW
jgi:type IV pilus assembly protein PilA